jgi:hypothetical protein
MNFMKKWVTIRAEAQARDLSFERSSMSKGHLQARKAREMRGKLPEAEGEKPKTQVK